MQKSRFILLTALTGLFLAAGCQPSWPNCKTDEHCQKNGAATEGFVCYNQQCVECKSDNDCTKKDGNSQCNLDSHRCESKNGCTVDADCASVNANFVCRSAMCVPECGRDEDCQSGFVCNQNNQRCEKGGCQCANDSECDNGYKCQDCQCVADAGSWQNISSECRPADLKNAKPGEVALGVVRFDFDKSEIRPDMRDVLDKNIRCLKLSNKKLRLEGHTDDRGTQEYNMALGENRAEQVKSYMLRMGVDVSNLRIVSKGENEPLCGDGSENCLDQNRRVEFIQY